ncbi:tetratricopeptide repeat protein [Lentisphaerota bacterium ZTH]|nr:tetratricopeptide repeat protein [Lentisphaerota bacterium]WET06673.1 tetratricopeptide repeat protein [Lentisphaerota bacterium ZTH]
MRISNFIRTAGTRRGGFLFFAAVLLSANTVLASKYRNRDLGDDAFKRNDYAQAVKFYQRYKAETATNNALRDSYIRLIAAYIRASDVKNAEAELNEFERKFPETDSVRKALYQADILTLKRQYRQAEMVLRSTLSKKVFSGQLYFQLLSALGFALIQQESWEDANEIYSLLERTGKGTNWEFIGFRQRLYCLIMSNQLRKSRELFLRASAFSKNPEFYDIELLSLMQMAKEKKFSELEKTYPSVLKKVPEGKNALVYQIASYAARHFLKNRQPAAATRYLRDAFAFAPTGQDGKNSLRELVNTYVKANMPDAAIKAALKYIEFYYDDPQTVDMQFQCATLMTKQKMYRDALGVYVALVHRDTLSTEQRISAAREAAKVFEATGSIMKAGKMLFMICQLAGTETGRMEGWYLMGKLYYRQKEYKKAVEAFKKVIASDTKWKLSASYWYMHSLLALKEYKAALHEADKLRKSKASPELAARAEFYHAYSVEKTGESERAFKHYLEFVEKHPLSEYAPRALFEAGDIAFSRAEYKKAAKIFQRFADTFPKDNMAANALYKCVYAEYLDKDYTGMNKVIDRMVKEYPQSDYTPAAQLWMVDYWRNSGEYTKASELLQKMQVAYAQRSSVMAQIFYDTALVHYRQKKYETAMKYLKRIIDKYSGSSVTADAYFLAGDVASSDGDYLKAADYYRRAAKMRPNSDFEIASLGRVADCDFTQYSRSFDKKLLEEAAGIYEKLLKVRKDSTVVRNQTMYKLGRCYELLSQEDKALDMYNELLYSYDVDKRKGVKSKPVWVVRAAYAAITIYLKYNTPEAAMEAIRVYRILKSMNLNTGEDFDKFISNIKEKYRL